MKKFKTKKNLNIRMMFFLVIFLLTLILYLDISSNFSLGLISLIEPVVKQNLTKSLSDNFKLSILKNYDIDNLVTIKYNDNNELADVNFRINDAYSLASEICNELKLFEDKKIRAKWDEEKEKWYFSVVDIVSALTDNDYQAGRKA